MAFSCLHINSSYSSSSSGASSSIKPLQRMVYDCVVSADRDVQYNLINNVVLCGGASSYDNMVDRLRYEVHDSLVYVCIHIICTYITFHDAAYALLYDIGLRVVLAC
jgi:actin-related protein